MLVSIIIPAHNEETALRKLLPLLDKELREIKREIEVILVDDASTDNTKEVILKFIKNKPLFHLIVRKKQGGQVGCYMSAFKIAKGQYIIRMDGDMQDDPSDLKLFIEKILEGNELVVGLRSKRSHALVDVFGTRLFDLVALILFRSSLLANTSSFVAFKSELVKDLSLKKSLLLRNEHRYLILIALSRGVKKYAEVVVKHNPRLGGKSHYKSYRKYLTSFIEIMVLLLRIKFGYYKRRKD